MEVNESAHIRHRAGDDRRSVAASRRGKRVVHVEDDDDLRFICGEILSDAGFDVLGCPTLAAARVAIEACVPDLVLIDRDLPDGSGLELVRSLRSEPALEGLLIVTFSGRKTKADIEHAILAGSDAFVGKPCAPHILVETVEALVRSEADVGRHWTGVRRKVAAPAP